MIYVIKTKSEIGVVTEQNSRGVDKLFLANLADFPERNPKVKLFSLASLKPGEEVEYHIHEGESESYYIISGRAFYNDNGVEMEIQPGTVTYTPSGTGHGIKNAGNEMLEFIALIILD